MLDTVQRARARAASSRRARSPGCARELARAGDRWVLVFTHKPLDGLDGGEPLRALLDADPRVVAAIAGNTHRNTITPRPTAAGGYWLITTSSLADFPQQARMFRLRETAGGGAVLETWMVDTAADPLADTARGLAYLDAQGGRPDALRGRPARPQRAAVPRRAARLTETLIPR